MYKNIIVRAYQFFLLDELLQCQVSEGDPRIINELSNSEEDLKLITQGLLNNLESLLNNGYIISQKDSKFAPNDEILYFDSVYSCLLDVWLSYAFVRNTETFPL